MSVADKQLKELKEQIDAGFLVADYDFSNGIHTFSLPALEYDHYTIAIPDSSRVQEYITSPEFAASRLQTIRMGVALLDIVDFSSNPDDVQFKMIVRYQSLVRQALIGRSVRRMLSIGDGTIFVFDNAAIQSMPETMFAVECALNGFNQDWRWDGVPEIVWRIGMHVGNVYVHKDINGQENFTGSGINLAQRVSQCVPDVGDEVDFNLNSTIYVSEDAYNAFKNTAPGQGFEFCDAGDRTVKKTHLGHVYAMTKCTRDG